MSTFNEREKAFESKFQHDQEMAFKIAARRNKLLGLWAAKELGLTGAAADDYAKTVVVADIDLPGDDDVVAKVLSDMKAKSLPITEHRIRAELAALQAEARKQVMGA